jgi:hypothetical protein
MEGRPTLPTKCEGHQLINIEVLDSCLVSLLRRTCNDFGPVRGYLEICEAGESQQVALARAMELGPNSPVIELVAVEGRRSQLRLRARFRNGILDHSSLVFATVE